MNMQSLMQQAQKMQKDIAKKQDELEKMEFAGSSELVDLVMKGDHKIAKVSIKSESLDKDDIEVLEDMIVIAYNDALSKLNKETESKMGAYSKMGGMF